jgi:3-oxoacyl-[acyl-carrier-protein] synthase-3
MSIVIYKNVGITALAACVPSRVIDNYHYDLDIWPEDEVKKVVDKVGVAERRFVDNKTCASDLCQAASEQLIAVNDISETKIN